MAKDDDLQRVDLLARIRFVDEQWRWWGAMVCADELDMHLLPKVGDAWMPKGTQLAAMTPGTTEKHDLAGALELATGTVHHSLGPRKTNELFQALLQTLDTAYSVTPYRRLSVVIDNDKIHQAKAIEPWFAKHPRFERRFLPTSCPRANPIERAFGEVQDLCTRITLSRISSTSLRGPRSSRGSWPRRAGAQAGSIAS